MTSENDIAIVGMALRVPGALTLSEYWRNLAEGRESLQAFSTAELRAEGVSAATLENPDYVRAGMTLAGYDEFDAGFFGFSPMEAAVLDPQHRQFYEVAWEALENAGCVPERFAGSIGVFAGCGAGTYFHQNVLRNPDLLRTVGYFLLRHTGNDKDFLATRVSYAFNLRGPSLSVQTACSTSLVTTHLAVQSLLARECDVALAGGVTIELPQRAGYLYHEGEILSPDGHCRAFDHRARGTVFGSGAGVVVLRRLADAQRDGDHIHAVIRASAVNNDGSSKVGYLAPSVEGQAAAISEAIALAGIESRSIGYVECHGTGTPIGDPIEVAALTQAFGEDGTTPGHCLIGSVKSNIGHLDTAAGVASLIKAALALQHGSIPPTINFEAPNPALGLEGSPFRVADRMTPWPRGNEPRRAAVNSLGVGGTNAFVVLEEAPAPVAIPAADSTAQTLVFSAKSRAALDACQARLADWLRAHPGVPLAQVAHTLGHHRQAFAHRRVLAAATSGEAAQLLESQDSRRVFTHTPATEALSVVFMFPGGGAQYAGMARDLYQAMPVFRESMDRGFDILSRRFGTQLREAFLATAGTQSTEELLQRPSVQLPLVFLIECALVSLWESLGVTASALIGHSMGENAAACVAGVISLEDALGLVLLRGQLMDEVPDGGMLSVAMSAQDLQARLGPDLDLAAANSPLLSIASGPVHALEALRAQLAAEGIESRRVRIHIAAHSRLLEGILGRFRAYLQAIRLHPPRIPIVSNRTGTWLTDAEATDPEYWVGHLRNTVRFAEGVQLLLQDKSRLYVEAGPGNILGTFVRQSHDAIVQRVFASMRHRDEPVGDDVHLRAVAGRLWASGLEIEAARLWPGAWTRVPLPGYAFQHSRYWIDPAAGEAHAGDDEALFPERVPFGAEWFWEPRWVQQGIALGAAPAPQVWCVFHHGDPVARTCVEALREQGHEVIEVLSGDALARIDAQTWSLAPEAGGAAYEELLQRLVEDNRVPDRILHTWLLTRSETFRPGQTFLHRNQVHGFYSLFHLARAFSRRAEGKRSHWTVIANGLASVAGEPLAYPEKATVLGPALVIPREFGNISCSIVDLSIENGQTAAAAIAELDAPAESAVVAWRNGVRWLRYLAPFRPDAKHPPLKLRQGGTYLITGGYGGIASIIAEWLARTQRARLVLMSRTPLPDRADWSRWLAENPPDEAIAVAIRRVRLLEKLGATVHPVAADVAVAEQVESALEGARAALGPIHGVFHAAGVLHDGLIALKGEREIEDVLAPKLYGTMVLDRALRAAPPDFLLLFSSTSAFVAPAGQCDYVAANAFLNAYAEARRPERDWPVVAMDWGIWRNVGMARDTSARDGSPTLDELSTTQTRRAAPDYPLFMALQVFQEGREQVFSITGQVSTADSWIVDDHRLLDGQSLFPGSGYLELVRATLAAARLGDGRWTATNLRFLEPFFIPAEGAALFVIRLRGAAAAWHFQVEVNHIVVVTAEVRLGAATTDLDVPDAAALAARCTLSSETAIGAASLRTRQEAHLKFGPRWQVLHSLRLGQGEAAASLQLREGLEGDLSAYPLHPGLLDIATGCAMDLIPGYREQEVPQQLWVPVRYGEFRQLAPLPREFSSWIRLSPEGDAQDGSAAFDVLMFDAAGNPLAVVKELALRRLSRPLNAAATLRDAQRPGTEPEDGHASAGEEVLRHNRSHGIADAEGIAALERLFTTGAPPVLVSTSLRPADLSRQARAVTLRAQVVSTTMFARPRLESEFESPRDELERSLAEAWGRLLGIQGVGIRDNFFELGGHSLIAVRLFNEIAERHRVDLPMSALIQHPDIAGLAERIRGSLPETATAGEAAGKPEPEGAFLHAVPIKSGPVGDGTPVFVVAGMFGNVLNLSHLANLLGEDRAFFALQARGLYGSQQPHESFEDMARDYVAEIRRIQPRGPYLIGGFSGGGLVAFEMVRQLEAAGERTAALVLLDTPIREPTVLSVSDKLQMWLPGLRREGLGFVVRKLQARRQWRRELEATEAERRQEGANPTAFHSRRVGDAFLRALAKYQVGKADVPAILFRPRLSIAHRLGDGRLLDHERNVLKADNGWTPHVSSLKVIEVPGNHDSMVLEPNVRVLAATLRRLLKSHENPGKNAAAPEADATVSEPPTPLS